MDRVLRAYRRILGSIAVGALLALCVPLRLPDVAILVAAPFGSIFVGISFAWAVTTVSLLQTPQGQRFGETGEGLRFRTFTMKFIFTVLTVFLTMLMWALVATRVFNGVSLLVPEAARFGGRSLAFAATAFMFTEMWDAILDVSRMLLTVELIRRRETRAKADEASSNATELSGVRVERADQPAVDDGAHGSQSLVERKRQG